MAAALLSVHKSFQIDVSLSVIVLVLYLTGSCRTGDSIRGLDILAEGPASEHQSPVNDHSRRSGVL